jgi:hypothetical protein
MRFADDGFLPALALLLHTDCSFCSPRDGIESVLTCFRRLSLSSFMPLEKR